MMRQRRRRPSDIHQEHPIKLYLVVWAWLFILSACSYMVDYVGLQGYLRWSLILIFMMLKAGLIVAFFMHMAWERLALTYAIILPPVLVLVFVAMMVFEADYTLLTRLTFFGRTLRSRRTTADSVGRTAPRDGAVSCSSDNQIGNPRFCRDPASRSISLRIRRGPAPARPTLR